MTARLGSRPSAPPPASDSVQPLMKIGVDARDKIIEKNRQGDARDKIILKNRTKYKDAREKIGHPPQSQPVEQQPVPLYHGRHEVVRPHAAPEPDVLPVHPPPPPHRRSLSHPAMEPEPPMEEDLPRRRADARIIGRNNNIIVMAKNDYSDDRVGDGNYPPLRHSNPVVMIKNDRARNSLEEEAPPPRYRAQPPPAKARVASPRRADPPPARRPHAAAGTAQRRQVKN